MSMDPAEIDGLGDSVAAIYSDAEVTLLGKVKKAAVAAMGVDDSTGTPPLPITPSERQLMAMNTLGNEARGVLRRLAPVVTAEINAAVKNAASKGGSDAATELPGRGMSSGPAINKRAVTALAAETAKAVTASHNAILRNTLDAYRTVTERAAGLTVTGTITTKEALQLSLDSLAAEGIRGFTDKAGRSWKMDVYVRMATQTATVRAYRKGHDDELIARGYDLVVVSSHARCAKQCAPFQGKVLSLTGDTPAGPHVETNRLTGKPITVDVECSLEDARRRGFQHPNCAHTTRLLVPGATRPPVVPYDKDAEDERAELRRLERKVREKKRDEAAALTPAAAKVARARTAAARAKVKAHAEATGQKRKPNREVPRSGSAAEARPRPDLITPDRETMRATTKRDATPDAPATTRPAPRTISKPPRQLTEAQGRRLGIDTWFDYADKLDGPQRKAVVDYTGNDYQPINELLREDLPTPGTAAKVALIDAAIDAAPRVPETIVVGRSVAESVFGISKREGYKHVPDNAKARLREAQALIGRSLTDDGFMSTTMASAGFPVEAAEVRMVIEIPAGTRALYVSGHANVKGLPHPRSLASFGPEENELLVGRGAGYEVTGAEIDAATGRITIRARITGQQPKEISTDG